MDRWLNEAFQFSKPKNSFTSKHTLEGRRYFFVLFLKVQLISDNFLFVVTCAINQLWHWLKSVAFTTKIQLRLNVKFLNNSRSHLVFSSGQVLTAEPQSSDRDAAGFSNPGGLAVMWGLVVIGLTGLPNSGWAKAHPAHPLVAALL